MALVNGREVVMLRDGNLKAIADIELALGRSFDLEDELRLCGCEIVNGPPKHVLPMALFYASERKDGSEMLFTVKTVRGNLGVKLCIRSAMPESGGGELWCLTFGVPSGFRETINWTVDVFYKTLDRTGHMSLEKLC
ncbi:MAG: hypothetical protein WCJ29_02950 [bacterium]